MVQPDFDDLAKIHGAVNYKAEASFALNILAENEYLANVAMGNQDSLKRAIINVAAIGLTLNPISKLAYLVPRDKKVCLDISYLGYVKLATESGALKWAVADVVCKNDEYVYMGAGKEPRHKFDPFGDRGEVVGAYCLAKTRDDEFIVTPMSKAEIYAIRDKSSSYKSGSFSPWKSDENEMMKKTVIRRASKSWPSAGPKERFEKALDIANDIELVDSSDNSKLLDPALSIAISDARDHALATILELLHQTGREESKLIQHLSRSMKREIKKIEDLTDIEMDQTIAFLNQIVEKERKNENTF